MTSRHEDYHWLGQGIYFWEASPKRALDFAKRKAKLGGSSIKRPAVIGAVLDLGECLDLTEIECLDEMKFAYSSLQKILTLAGEPMPDNNPSKDWDRRRDCAVIEHLHALRRVSRDRPCYDSVRSPFPEGKLLYEGTKFTELAHIQIAIRNPNCIKGTFWARDQVKWEG